VRVILSPNAWYYRDFVTAPSPKFKSECWVIDAATLLQSFCFAQFGSAVLNPPSSRTSCALSAYGVPASVRLSSDLVSAPGPSPSPSVEWWLSDVNCDRMHSLECCFRPTLPLSCVCVLGLCVMCAPLCVCMCSWLSLMQPVMLTMWD
jgi:hypothetical protein